MLYTTCLANLDDIIIFVRNFMEILARLATALERFGQTNLKYKPSKCAFGITSIIMFGNVISDNGISIYPKKFWHIKVRPRLYNTDKVCSFLEYATYYPKIIKNIVQIVDPLNKL